MGSRWGLPLALVAAMLVPARDAAAQGTTAGQSQADASFNEGRELLEKGRFAEACPKLARSEELAPAVGTLLNLAYCYEQLGKLRSAMDAYAEAQTLASAAGDVKKTTFAKDRFAAVEPRAPKLVLRVVSPEAPGLEIKRNAVIVAKTDLDHPIAVDPQDYVITASAAGHVTWKGAIIVHGDGAVVTLLVPPLERVAMATAAAPTKASPLTIKRIAGLGLGAVSALAIGGGIAAAFSAKARYDDAGPHCDATGCDEVGASIQSGAATQGNIATALIGLGVLAGAAGVYLWIVGAPEGKPVGVVVSPLGASLGGRF